jgi:hypothetical protein
MIPLLCFEACFPTPLLRAFVPPEDDAGAVKGLFGSIIRITTIRIISRISSSYCD